MAYGLWLVSNLDPLIVGQASNRKENVSVGVPAFRKSLKLRFILCEALSILRPLSSLGLAV